MTDPERQPEPDPDAGMDPSFDPWQVTPRTCELILQRAFPHLRIESIDLLGEGWDSNAFLISNKLVFRFPKRPAVARMLERERALLLAIDGRLPLPISRYLHVADSIPGLPYGYGVGGYRLIPGEPLNGFVNRGRVDESVAVALAGFLKALHEIDPGEASPAAAVPLTVDDWWHEHWELMEAARPLLRSRISSDAGSTFEREWERAFTIARRTGFRPVLVHRDLSMEHILIDNAGMLAGIIDFGDAGLGDPAIDFAGLPNHLAHLALLAYNEDEQVRERLSVHCDFYRSTVPLHAICAGIALEREDLLEEGFDVILNRYGR